MVRTPRMTGIRWISRIRGSNCRASVSDASRIQASASDALQTLQAGNADLDLEGLWDLVVGIRDFNKEGNRHGFNSHPVSDAIDSPSVAIDPPSVAVDSPSVAIDSSSAAVDLSWASTRSSSAPIGSSGTQIHSSGWQAHSSGAPARSSGAEVDSSKVSGRSRPRQIPCSTMSV